MNIPCCVGTLGHVTEAESTEGWDEREVKAGWAQERRLIRKLSNGKGGMRKRGTWGRGARWGRPWEQTWETRGGIIFSMNPGGRAAPADNSCNMSDALWWAVNVRERERKTSRQKELFKMMIMLEMSRFVWNCFLITVLHWGCRWSNIEDKQFKTWSSWAWKEEREGGREEGALVKQDGKSLRQKKFSFTGNGFLTYQGVSQEVFSDAWSLLTHCCRSDQIGSSSKNTFKQVMCELVQGRFRFTQSIALHGGCPWVWIYFLLVLWIWLLVQRTDPGSTPVLIKPRCAFGERTLFGKWDCSVEGGFGVQWCDEVDTGRVRLRNIWKKWTPVSLFGLRSCFLGFWPARKLSVGPQTIQHCAVEATIKRHTWTHRHILKHLVLTVTEQ